jgi:Bacterial Ig domain
MAAQVPRREKSRSWIAWGCGIGGALALLLAVVVGAFLLLRNRSGPGLMTVRIMSPSAEQQAPLNEPLGIAAEASNRAGVSRVEVYADGALILAQDSGPKVGAELRVIGNWVPTMAGQHTLMARGYGPRHMHGDSQLVYIKVPEPPDTVDVDVDSLHPAGSPGLTLGELATALGTTPGDLAAHSPDLGGLSGSDTVPPGVHIHAPPHPESPPAPTEPPPPPGAPPAPTGLMGSADCVNAVLTWNPVAGAQTYSLYRVGPLPTTASPVRAAAGLTMTRHSDALPTSGSYQYQVTAVRDGAESILSAPAILPGGHCAEPAVGTAGDLVLTVAAVQTDEVYNGLYCYLHIRGGADDRYPSGDFTFVPRATSDPHYYDMTSLPGGGRFDLSDQALTSPVTFGGHCIGVTVPTLPDPNPTLGYFDVSHPMADWDGSQRTADGSTFYVHYCLGHRAQPCSPNIPGDWSSGGVALDLPLDSLALPAPTNLTHMPGTDAFAGVDSCTALPDPLDQVDCAATGSAAWGREMVFWQWHGNATYPESSLTGYTVQRTHIVDTPVVTYTQAGTWDVTARRSDGSVSKRFFSSDRDVCGGRIEYRTRANAGAVQSVWSDPVSFSALPCVNAVDVRVTFETLDILPGDSGFVNDVDSYSGRDTRPEVWGYIFAHGGSMQPTRVDVSSGSVIGPFTPDVGQSLDPGRHQWADLDMYVTEPSEEAGHGSERNVFRTRITDSTQTITFGAQLWEGDTDPTGYYGVRHTPWCMPEATTVGPFSLQEWVRGDHGVLLTGGNSESRCAIVVSVVATPVP